MPKHILDYYSRTGCLKSEAMNSALATKIRVEFHSIGPKKILKIANTLDSKKYMVERLFGFVLLFGIKLLFISK